ncbi:hypothetical protein [Gorillibacterium timonense]|uniref:hypothetical protein n=1 Tax=Gorillibacterium timonense TaxID=1689269 RepID=UPI00071D98E3|nr:hypothetical protein [Gorillibacterium timonense]
MSRSSGAVPNPAIPSSVSGAAFVPLTLHNLRLIATYSWLAVPVILAFMVVLANPAFMGPPQAALWGERFISLTALLLFPPLALMDAGGVGETLLAKRYPHLRIFVMRWLLTAVYMAVLTIAFLGFLRLFGATFELAALVGGVWMTALALGSIGMLASVLFGSLPAGFILAFAWYLMDWTTKGKFTGSFYLFSMAKGVWNSDKLWLLGVALVSTAISAWLLPKSLGGEAYR